MYLIYTITFINSSEIAFLPSLQSVQALFPGEDEELELILQDLGVGC